MMKLYSRLAALGALAALAFLKNSSAADKLQDAEHAFSEMKVYSALQQTQAGKTG